MSRRTEAESIWDWVQWRLPPDIYLRAHQVLRPDPPTVSDPQLQAGLAELLDPSTTNARRLQLVQQLLIILRDEPPV